MTVKIESPIVGFSIEKKADGVPTESTPLPTESVPPANKPLRRPPVLEGRTYQLKTPQNEAAFYLTINKLDGVPYELFINSRDTHSFQWVAALTRLASLALRKGIPVADIASELESIADPNGGYWEKHRYIPSLVAGVGVALTRFATEAQEGCVCHADGVPTESVPPATEVESGEYPPNAILCKKCNHKSMILMDGCLTCLNCGDSKCG